MKHKFVVQQACRQRDKAVLVGCIPFGELIKKVRFHSRSESEGSEGYQREVIQRRIAGIQKHIEACFSQYEKGLVAPLFPTSIILAFDYNVDDLKPGMEIEVEFLPDDILVVDGQHRLKGMEYLRDKRNETLTEYINSHMLNCSILLNYDLWEQAQVFASVNFNQKPVTKSLFYEIYGIEGPSGENASIPLQNEIYIAHRMAETLNTHNKSALKGMIKMIGTGKGYFSQAALVEALIKYLKPGKVWGDIVEELKLSNSTGKLNAIMRELMVYFEVIKDSFKEFWPNEDDKNAVSIIVKSTGIASLIDFLAYLHPNIPNKILSELPYKYNDSEVIEGLKNFFQEAISRLIPIKDILFSPDTSEFRGAGGRGLQKRLFERMRKQWLDSSPEEVGRL